MKGLFPSHCHLDHKISLLCGVSATYSTATNTVLAVFSLLFEVLVADKSSKAADGAMTLAMCVCVGGGVCDMGKNCL